MFPTVIPKNEASFTLAEVAEATNGQLVDGDPKTLVRGVSIDSRQVNRGELFVALRGAVHDGHRFIDSVLNAGACAVLVETADFQSVSQIPFVLVTNTVLALGQLASFHRRRWPGTTLVAITGSVGKTTTKELCALALSTPDKRVLSTFGNLNNAYGLPLTLLQLTDAYDVAVVEMGAGDALGTIARLCDIAQPDVGIVTNASLAHAEFLGTSDDILKEKGSMFFGVKKTGVVIACGDDPRLLQLTAASCRKMITFGSNDECDVRLLDVKLKERQTEARIKVNNTADPIVVQVQLIGESSALNVTATLAAAMAVGVPVDDAVQRIADCKPLKGRLRVFSIGECTVLEDVYNACPDSVKMGLKTLVHLAAQKAARTVAVIGDMKELGQYTTNGHDDVISFAGQVGVNVVVACGAEMSRAASAAASSGGQAIHIYSDSADAANHVDDWLKAGDFILLKGSRLAEMEKVLVVLQRVVRCEAS